MVWTRTQEQRLSRLEEWNDETNQKLDAIIGRLSRLLGNQRSDDQFTLNRSTTPSVKAKGSGSDHFDRSGNDRRFDEIPEGLVHKTILEEKSTSQFQVPIANSEIVRSIEPGKVDLGLENEDYVVLNENLEQEWDQMNVNEKLEVDGDVERGQKMISDTETSCAHKVLVKMPSKEKCLKHLKAWKFKFKPTSKRSKLKDDRFSFVEETSWFKKNPKETIWDCFKKEFKETMAAYGRTRVDRFKLVEEKASRPEVLNLNQTCLYHQIGHGVDTLLAFKMLDHEKEMEAPLYPHKSTGNNLHHIAHQLLDKRCLRIHSKKLITKCLKSWRFKFKISSMKARPKLFCFVVDGYKTTRIYYGIIGFARFLELCYTLNLFVTQDEGFMESFNNLVCSSWIDEQFERRWSKMICRFEHNENDWIHSLVDTNDCEIWPDKTHVELQEMSCFLSEQSVVGFVGYKAHGRELLVVGVKQLTLAAKKFYLKHKWRSRLLQSFSVLKQRIIMSLWGSLDYLMEEDLKQQGNSEPLVIVPDVDAKVELVWESNSLVFHFKTRVWDPGRSLIEDATPREFPFHSTATIYFSLLFFLSRITCKFSSLQTLRTRFP